MEAIEYANWIVTLMVIHLLASILAAEPRDLRLSLGSLIVQSLTLSIIFAFFAFLFAQPWLYSWAVWTFLTKVLIIPGLLIWYVRMFPKREADPFIGFRVGIVLLLIFLTVFYRLIYTYMYFIVPIPEAMVEPAKSSLALAFTVFALGVYITIVKRDVVKVIIGIIILENGIHLSLLTLAPTLPETTILGITTNIFVAAWLLLYLAGRIYVALGTTDTAELSELKR